MADIVCNCPHCQQAVTLDDAWAGQQLQCPICQQPFIAPGAEAPPPPPPRRPFPPPGGHGASQRAGAASASAGGGRKWGIIVAIVVVLGVGTWFTLTYGSKWQKQFSSKMDKEAEEGGGGQMGHIASVYEVLDATDPDKGFEGRRGASGLPRGDRLEHARGGEKKELPVLPAVWTLDLAAAKIPEGLANGSISGAKFLCESARLEIVGNAIVLSLRQGGEVPDREILVYLHPKTGEKIGGGSWSIAKEMKGPSVPQAAKRWRTDPRYAPTMKSFATGYALKLELGPIRDGELEGKIFIALPDPEQTVVAGIFTAETSLPDTPVNAPTAAPKP